MTHSTVIQLTDTGVIDVRGENAKTFLQGQLTCDIRALTPQKTHFAAYCNRQGRIQTSCRVYCIDDHHFLLSLPNNQIKSTLQTLTKYGRFSRIVIEDVSLDWVCYGMIGKSDSTPKHVDECCVYDDRFITKIRSHSSVLRYEVLVKTNNDIFSSNNEIALWRYHDIRSGIAIIDKPAANHFLPHHINYHLIHAINLKKGCYLGQEIITRMHHLGKLKQQGYCVVLDSQEEDLNIQCYDPIVNITNPEKTIGHVVNVVYYDEAYHLLASIRDKACDGVLALMHYLDEDKQLALQPLPYHL